MVIHFDIHDQAPEAKFPNGSRVQNRLTQETGIFLGSLHDANFLHNGQHGLTVYWIALDELPGEALCWSESKLIPESHDPH